jgi:CelD/BcsL family acetyltransferase involved in cellulose biosynthesis
VPIQAQVRARIHPIDTISDDQVAAWRRLAANAVEPNPFFEPDFVLPAARHLSARDVALLVVEGPAGWVACMPVTPVRLVGVSAGLGTWRHPYCFLGTPLVDRDSLTLGLAELLRYPLRDKRLPLFVLQSMTDGPLLSALRLSLAEQKLAISFESGHERATLQRRADGEYADNMRAHHRREFKRLWRRLEESLGDPIEVEEDRGDGPALDEFLRLEASGWKGRSATALATDPAHAAFFRELCAGFAAQGRLQMLTMKVGERSVAMKCNIAAGDTLFCFKIAHDEELRRYSPGVQLERANIGIFHERRGEQLMDSCAAPDNIMINRLWPDRRNIISVVVSRRGARNVVSRQGFRAAHAVRSRRDRRTSSTSS